MARAVAEAAPSSRAFGRERSASDVVSGGREALILTAVLIVTAALYGGTLVASFVWDDPTVVLPVASHAPGAVLKEAFAGGVAVNGVRLGYFRPLVDLSYAVDGWLWGLRPFGFHLTNLLLYLLCVGLAFGMARHFAGPGLAAAATCLAFALHPVHVESVAWVQGRGDLLGFAGVAAALLAFLRSLEAERAWPWRLAAGLAALAGALAKELALVAPLLAAAWWGLAMLGHGGPATPGAEPRAGIGAGAAARGRRIAPPQVMAALAPLLLALGVYALLRVAAQVDAVAGTAKAHLPVRDRWLVLGPTYGRYVGLLLWPHPLSAYRMVPVPGGWGTLPVIAGICLFGATLGTAAWAWRRRPRAAFALAWFLLALLPVLPAWPIKGFTMAERYLFLPSFGFALGVGLLAARGWRFARTLPARGALAATGAALAITWGALASARVPDWVNPIEFYRAMVRTAPDFALAHTNLGALLVADGSVEEGMRHLERALALQPDMPEAHSNLGLGYVKRGDPSGGLAELRTAVRLRPQDSRILGDLARTLMDLRRFPEAVSVLRQLEALRPDSPDVARQLAEAYEALGDRRRAGGYATLAERLAAGRRAVSGEDR